MEYNKLVAVTGLPGLYEAVGSKSDGAIVRSLEDGSTKFVSSRVHNLSHLESIEVYTVRENVLLADVFTAMKNNSQVLPDAKDNAAIKKYFEAIYPDMDFERVYASDMKKMIKWFGLLQQHQVDFTPKENEAANEEEPQTEAVEAPATQPSADTPAEEKPKRSRKKKEEE